MNNFVKMDVAIELLADHISKATKLFYETNNQIYRQELNDLMLKRNNLYSGDINTIENIINTYGK